MKEFSRVMSVVFRKPLLILSVCLCAVALPAGYEKYTDEELQSKLTSLQKKHESYVATSKKLHNEAQRYRNASSVTLQSAYSSNMAMAAAASASAAKISSQITAIRKELNWRSTHQLSSIVVSCSGSVTAGKTLTLSCVAKYASGSSEKVSASWSITKNSQYATLSGTTLKTKSSGSGKTVTVRASFRGKTATKNISISKASVKSLAISGESTVRKKSTFTCTAKYRGFGKFYGYEVS